MKLLGETKQSRALILVASGSTHNFVAESVVEEHKLPVEKVPAFSVQIGNKTLSAPIKSGGAFKISCPA